MKIQSGRSMLEMLLVLFIMGIIAAGGVWGVEYALNQHTKNQIEQEVITQMSKVRMRSRTLNGQSVKGKYIKSRKVENGLIILTTAEDISEEVCNALISEKTEVTETQKGYRVRLASDKDNCTEENILEFISPLRSDAKIVDD